MAESRTNMYDVMKQALNKAEEELSKASYLEECGSNSGIRKMNSNKVDWLKWVVYLAKLGLEVEKLFIEQDDFKGATDFTGDVNSQQTVEIKDKIIADLQTVNERLKDQLSAVSLSKEELELKYRAQLERSKIDAVIELSQQAHNQSWLDGTVLVCAVELIDRYLLSLIKE